MSDQLPAAINAQPWGFDLADPEERMSKNVRITLYGFGALTLALALALVLVPIGGAVVAGGAVGVESRVKRIAHPTGGVVSQILVSNGDHVAQGQLLARLDNGVSGKQNELSNLTVAQLAAQRARLDAERLGLAAIRFPADLLASNDPGAKAAMADEARLFATRRAESGQMRAQLAARIAQYNKQISGFSAQISALRQQQSLIAPERAGVRELWNKGLVTINRLNQLERTSADLDGSIAALQAQIAQAQARISETQEQILTLGESRRAESGSQFAAISNTINDQQVKSVSASDIDRRSAIRAPYAGIVDKLQLTAIGDVVKPADTILEIVPDGDRLTVEAAIAPNDIDQVRAGQTARIRFTAFNNTASPEIRGKVTFVAADRTTRPETGQSFFEARIAVDPADLRRHPEIVLRPGMPAEVYIQTGSRSMLSYITKPLRDQFARAFRDN